jgi:hypothetical protein
MGSSFRCGVSENLKFLALIQLATAASRLWQLSAGSVKSYKEPKKEVLIEICPELFPYTVLQVNDFTNIKNN